MRQSTNASSTSVNNKQQEVAAEPQEKVESSAIRSRKEVLNNRVDEILGDILKFQQQEEEIFDSTCDRVRFLAITLEEIFMLSELDSQINTISSTIKRMFRDKGIIGKENLIDYALPKKFRNGKDPEVKREEVMKTSVQTAADNFVTKANKLVAQSKNIFDLARPEYIEQLQKQGRDAEIRKIRDQLRAYTESVGEQVTELRRLNRILGDQLDIGKVKCEQLGVAVDPEKVTPPKDVVSAIPLKSGYTRFYEVAVQYGKLWLRIAEKIWKYRPLTDKQAEELAEVMEMQLEMDKPLADEKFRLEIVQWILALAHEAMEGKHAAAEAYHYMLPKQTQKALNKLGEDTIRLAIDPDSGKGRIEVEKVAIVREQVGDVKEPMARLTANILLALFPKYVATVTHFVAHQGWSIAKRKQDVHEKLSKAA